MHEIENGFYRHNHLEVICGPMFSGKTEELIRRIRRVEYARMNAIVFKPKIDVRYSHDLVVSHSEQKIESVPVDNIDHIRKFLGSSPRSFRVIGLDEIHFFDKEIIDVCEELVGAGIRVIAAGLCEDYQSRPFGSVPELLAHADVITKLWAVCMRCGLPASKTQRIQRPGQEKLEAQVVVGAGLHYEARCRSCHVKGIVTLTNAEIEADINLVRSHV
jgi:thymidine kinase